MNKPQIYLSVFVGSVVVYSVVLLIADQYTNQGVILGKVWIGLVGGTTIILGRYIVKRYSRSGADGGKSNS